MKQPVIVAFASGSENLLPAYYAKVREVAPALPLVVMGEFPPGVQANAMRWIPWYPMRDFSDNFDYARAMLSEYEVRFAALLLEPKQPYWPIRWIAALGWPLRLLIFNENLDHFMLRSGSATTILRHTAWRIREFARKQLRPGGAFYTLLWRLRHPKAFRRPLLYSAATLSSGLAIVLRRLLPTRIVASPEAALPDGITIVVPSRNGREMLANLFDSLEPVDEIIVVDNGSADGTADWLALSHPRVESIVEKQPLSFAAAVNRGIYAARFRYTLLLNNDMVPEPGFCSALLKPFESNPNLFATTAQIFLPIGKARQETGKANYRELSKQRGIDDLALGCDLPISGEDESPVLYGSGGCTLYDTAKLRALGGFDERYAPAYVEDLDAGWRAWRQGWPTVYAGNARVLHLHRQTTNRYFTSAQLENILEFNYLRFAAASASPRVWNEALIRLNRRAARQEPVVSAAAALGFAWKAPLLHLRPVQSKLNDERILAFGSGRIAVFPGAHRENHPRVLMAAPYLPFPLSHGGAVRMYNLMREAAKEYSLVLLAFVDKHAPPAPELLELCAEVICVAREGSHLMPTSPRPDVVEEFDHPAYHAALHLALEKWSPEIVQLEFTQMAQYARECGGAKTLLVEHDITLDLYNQLLADREDWETRRQHKRWLRFERKAWTEVDRVVVMSEQDRNGIANAVVLPNGVDLQRFRPSGSEPEPGRILFIGSFAHLPNLLAIDYFLREVWPGLDAALHIIAGERHEYFEARHSNRVQVNLQQAGITVEGFVRDVRPAYERASVVIAPLVASAGTNIKIMEAMAMGKAIVSTPAGVNGLDLAPGRDILVAATAREFADAVRSLLEDAKRRKSIEAQARATVEREFDWVQIGRRQSALYAELARR